MDELRAAARGAGGNEQAATLTEVCVATANSAQHGFDRAEARLAALESDFHRTTSELTREMQVLLMEVRQLSASGPRQLTGETPSWPLEGVTRLHQQLRESSPGPRALPAAVVGTEPENETAPAPTQVEAAAAVPSPEHVEAASVPPLTRRGSDCSLSSERRRRSATD